MNPTSPTPSASAPSSHASANASAGAPARPPYSGGRIVATIAAREFRTRSMTRGTIITFVLFLLLAVAAPIVITKLNSADEGDGIPEARTIAVVGDAPFAAEASGGAFSFDPVGSVEEARAAVDAENVDFALYPAEAMPASASHGWVLYGRDVSPQDGGFLESLVEMGATDGLLAARGIDPAEAYAARQAATLTVVDADAERFDAETVLRLVLVAVMLGLMVTSIMTFASIVAMSVVDEKSSRAVEILLSTVKPLHLLTGKILGAGLAGLGFFGIISAAGLASALISGIVPDVAIPWGLVGVLVLYFFAGYLLFSCLYAVAASLVSRAEDLNGSLTPIILVSMVTIYVPAFGWAYLDSPVMQVLSYLPPVSMTVAPLQFAMGNLSLWQALLALGILLLATLGSVLLAARLYPRTVLHSGGSISWIDALRGKSR